MALPMTLAYPMRKVAVVTGGRADYGLLRPLLRAIAADDELTLQVIVTGYHLSAHHGLTWQQIEIDGFTIDARVMCQQPGDSRLDMARSLGLGVSGMADALDRLQPDAVVVLGDRYEILAAAQTALLLDIPLVHIHGGELSQGAVDDAIRHAISKMAALHFCSTASHRRRLLQLGEDERRVFNTGALAVDNVASIPLWPLAEFNQRFGTRLQAGFLLVTLHPETAGGYPPEQLAQLLCQGLQPYRERGILVTGSNADAGGATIDRILQQFAAEHDQSWHFPALGLQGYLSAAALAAVVVGNSSSGLIEVPILGTPTLNIGIRQQGRYAPASVMTVEAQPAAITEALHLLLQTPRSGACLHEYGMPGVAGRMLEHLKCALAAGTALHKLPFVDRE